MTTEQQTTGISEAEDLTRMIVALCNGHDALTITVALSTVLSGLLIDQARKEAEALRGAPRRMQGYFKRHYLKAVAAALEPLDKVP